MFQRLDATQHDQLRGPDRSASALGQKRPLNDGSGQTIEALVGSDKRLSMVAEDFVSHSEDSMDAIDGEAMIICMSRRICVALYRKIVAFDRLPPSGAVRMKESNGGMIIMII